MRSPLWSFVVLFGLAWATHGWIGAQGLSAYCASKFGLRGFGESMAYDLHGTGVRVTNIYPSFARTPILDSPQYGFGERRDVPDYLVADPEKVVTKMIKGMVPLIDRRLSAQSIKAGRSPEN